MVYYIACLVVGIFAIYVNGEDAKSVLFDSLTFRAFFRGVAFLSVVSATYLIVIGLFGIINIVMGVNN